VVTQLPILAEVEVEEEMQVPLVVAVMVVQE
jgi:hypothetical protein